MKCEIIFERDPNTLKATDKIKAVKAPNGKRSILFDNIREQVKDDKKALENYYKIYTPQFKEWFGDWENDPKNASKVVDSNGQPLLVYHGSDTMLTEFKSPFNDNYFAKKGGNPKSIFFTSVETPKGSVYDRGNIIPVFLNIKDPSIQDDKGDRDNTGYPGGFKRLSWDADEKGNDGFFVLNTYDPFPTDLYVAFEPNQIKSLYNKGEYSESKDIYASVENNNSSKINELVKQISYFYKNYDKLKLTYERLKLKSVDEHLDEHIKSLNELLSEYTTSDNIESILDLIKTNDPDNIELAKQLIKGIIEGDSYASKGDDINNLLKYVYGVFEGLKILEKHYNDSVDEMIGLPGFKNFEKEMSAGYNKERDKLINKFKEALSIHVDAGSSDNITDLIKTNDPDNIELAKMLIQGIIENSTKRQTQSQRGKDPNVRSKYFYDGETQSHRVILQRIIDNQHPLSKLAEKLLSIPNIETNVILSKEMLVSERIGTAAGIYTYSANKIEISEPANFKGKGVEPTLMHEILHAYTVQELKRNTPAKRELEKIYQEALKYKDDFPKNINGDVYALTDLDEFLVAIYTDAMFIKTLQTIPSIGPNKSMWEDLLEFFKALFQFNSGERTLFDDAFYAANKIIDQGSRSVESMSQMPDTGFPDNDIYLDRGDDVMNKSNRIINDLKYYTIFGNFPYFRDDIVDLLNPTKTAEMLATMDVNNRYNGIMNKIYGEPWDRFKNISRIMLLYRDIKRVEGLLTEYPENKDKYLVTLSNWNININDLIKDFIEDSEEILNGALISTTFENKIVKPDDFREYINNMTDGQLSDTSVNRLMELITLDDNNFDNEKINLFETLLLAELSQITDSDNQNIENKDTYASKSDDDITTPLKSKFKGKLIYAQTGSGKTSIADNINVIDGDLIIAGILDTTPSQIAQKMKSLPFSEREEISKLYESRINELVKEGKTVITARLKSIENADYIVYNDNEKEVSKRTANPDRVNRYLNSKNTQDDIDYINNHIQGISSTKVIKLSDSQYLSDVLLNDTTFRLNQKVEKIIRKNDKALDKQLMNFISQFGVKVEEFNDLKDRLGVDSLGATDIMNKVIWLANNREVDTVPEEVAHMMTLLLGTNNRDINKLMYDIDKWSEYPAIYAEYMPIYDNEYKVRVEAIGKMLAKALVKEWDHLNLSNNDRVILGQVRSLIQKLLDTIKSIFYYKTPYDYSKNIPYEYDHASAATLARMILDGNSSIVNTTISKNKVKLNYQKAIDNSPKIAKFIIDTFSKSPFNYKIVGSLAISKQGDIYRDANEQIHDVDFIASGNLDELREFINSINGVQSHNGIPSDDYDTIAYYIPLPGYKIIDVERDDTSSNSLIDFNVIDDKGNVIPKVDRNNYVINTDFFWYDKPAVNQFTDDNVSTWQSVMEGKLNMSSRKSKEVLFRRPKDQLDYNLFKPNKPSTPFQNPKHIYYQLSKNNKSDISDTAVEDQFNLRNTDGSRKRFTSEDKALDKARKLNKENPFRPFKFTVIKVMGEKGDSRVYWAVKAIEREDNTSFSLNQAAATQPKSEPKAQPSTRQTGTTKIPVDSFRAQLGLKGYTEFQIKLLENYNKISGGLTGMTKKVPVSSIPNKKLRESFEKKGITEVERYISDSEKGFVGYRVSDIQDMVKTKLQTAEKAKEQEESPLSILSRNMGTKMHTINETVLRTLVESTNPAFQISGYADTEVGLWRQKALEQFKLTDTYDELLNQGKDIFLNQSKTLHSGEVATQHISDNMVDKLVLSMLTLYHQAYQTQNEINNEYNKTQPNPDLKHYHKPIFLLEKPLYDSGKDEAGTMDICVFFSDGTASIYDHKFTGMGMRQKMFDKPTAKELDHIYDMRRRQGLPYNDRSKYNNWYYELSDDLINFKKEESWNTQIGRYSEMLTKLYGVKSIRHARILPVATAYTTVSTGKKNANNVMIKAIDKDKSKVEHILTGIDGDLGRNQIALEVEKTGDVNLDKFIMMLLRNKKALDKERREKKLYNDPRYIDRIKKLDESIQALLISKDVTKIASSIAALANQIKMDLDTNSTPITFEQIITHLNDISMFESFIELSKGEIDKLELKHADEIEKGETNAYTEFKDRVGSAKIDLALQSKALRDKMVSMIYEENTKGKYMSEKLFETFKTQVDMTELGKFFTHLRESNHPILSLFSQLLDKVDTNVINERRELQSKINKSVAELTTWGNARGLKDVAIYKKLLGENNKLIWKYTDYKKEIFPHYMDLKNKKSNISWFKSNFERTGRKEEIFQTRKKLVEEYYKRVAKDDKEFEVTMNRWLNENDITYKNGDNMAWFNPFVQGYLTPINPDKYYSDAYKELVKPENKPLLNFYNLYMEQMNYLASKADFKIGENFIPEIRKDMMDTMIQDGVFYGLKQQGINIANYFTQTDKDDGFHRVDDGSEYGKKVPIFFTDPIGDGNKSFDLSKSLLIFSDFVTRYEGIKNMEHATLAMRELVQNTQGLATDKGKILRDAENKPRLAEGNNKTLLNAFDTWIDYYIYGEKKKGNELYNKIVDSSTAAVSRKSVALNFLSAAGGHINAEAQLNMLAKKAQYFDRSSLSKARKEVKVIGEIRDLFRRGKDATEAVDSKMVFSSFFFEISQEDLSHEKANSVSISSIRARMKSDYAFMLQRLSDDVIDNTTLSAMMMDYAIDPSTGKTYPIKRLKEMYDGHKTYGEGYEWKSLWDSIDMDNMIDGNIHPVIINQHTGSRMEDRTYTDFRRKVKQVITRAKGNMSAQDIAGYKTHMLGRLVMQFRGWIPSTVRERVKSEQYNLTMEQFEVGRWAATYGFVGKNLKKTMASFLVEILPFLKGNFGEINKDTVIDESSPMYLKYQQFLADNPHLEPDGSNNPDQVTFEQYYNTHVSEVRALAKEIQTYLALWAFGSMLLMAGGGDDELKESPLLRKSVALAERAQLEIGFFLPVPGLGFWETIQLFTRKPISAVDVLTESVSGVGNTIDETFEMIGLHDSEIDWWTGKKDNKNVAHFAHKWIPPVKFANSVFEFMEDSPSKNTWWDYFLYDEGFVK